MSRATRAILLLWCVSLCRPALAWDSHGELDVEGPAAARQRMRSFSGDDEHRQIWLRTLDRAGAPDGADADMKLVTFTASTGSLQPAGFLDATRVLTRTHSPSEFSQLPDFSYSLWDWALGNETCPLGPGINLASCHSFTGHMGAVNSNHFSPQNGTHYAHYHELALGRAADCALIRTKIGSRADLQPFLKACVAEALTLEAVGHHFLQDAWSSGHMWQRWGSPDLADFTLFTQARAVGAISGLIHGARGLLQSLAPEGVDVNDAMCAPRPEVTFITGGTESAGVGDLYLNDLEEGAMSSFSAQYAGMYGCAVGGVRAVLQATGETLRAPDITPIDPAANAAACFGMRATNQAMVAGYGIDYKSADGTQHHVPLDVLANGIEIVVLLSPQVPQANVATALLAFDLIRAGALMGLRATLDPSGTDIAEGAVGALLLVAPNGAFDKLGSYVDPVLPWPRVQPADDAHALALARVFHEAHARDWCDRFRAGDPEFDLQRLRDRVPATAGPEREAACAICTTFLERHLRVGDPASYIPSPDSEPLCGLIATTPGTVQYLYQPGPSSGAPDHHNLAAFACGCLDVQIEADLQAVIAGPATFTITVRKSDGAGGLVPAPNVLVELTPACAGIAPGTARTDGAGHVTATVTPNAGCSTISVDIVARADIGTTPLATTTVQAQVIAPPTTVTRVSSTAFVSWGASAVDNEHMCGDGVNSPPDVTSWGFSNGCGASYTNPNGTMPSGGGSGQAMLSFDESYVGGALVGFTATGSCSGSAFGSNGGNGGGGGSAYYRIDLDVRKPTPARISGSGAAFNGFETSMIEIHCDPNGWQNPELIGAVDTTLLLPAANCYMSLQTQCGASYDDSPTAPNNHPGSSATTQLMVTFGVM